MQAKSISFQLSAIIHHFVLPAETTVSRLVTHIAILSPPSRTRPFSTSPKDKPTTNQTRRQLWGKPIKRGVAMGQTNQNASFRGHAPGIRESCLWRQWRHLSGLPLYYGHTIFICSPKKWRELCSSHSLTVRVRAMRSELLCQMSLKYISVNKIDK